jgi:hypothetical protein
MSEPRAPDDPQDERLQEMMLGFADAIFALGATLANAGIVTREQLAAAMAEAQRQQLARPDARHPARLVTVALLAKLFALPVVGGSEAIERFGGPGHIQ